MDCKKDGSWGPWGDYCRLNLATTHDRYPLPSILDLSNKLHGCKFFSCIDLVKGSWDTGWTSTASGRSSGTYRPLVIFLPLRM